MLDLKVVTGRSNVKLAQKVAAHLGVELSETTIRNFSDGELWVKYEDNVRGVDLFVIQSATAPAENWLEMLLMLDAAKRASVKRVTAVIPYFGYARQDRKDQPRVPVTAKLMANLLTSAGADRIITIDLHSSQIQGFFDIPMDHLYASPVLIRRLRRQKMDSLVVASPDVGGIKTARAYAKRMDADLVLVDKRRPAHNVAEIVHVIGDVNEKNVIIVDDMIDTGTTFVRTAETLKERGALQITGVCVHPVFSGQALDKIEATSAVDKIFVTDTIPMKRDYDKIEVVSVSELLAEAIIRTHDNRSISSLFEIER